MIADPSLSLSPVAPVDSALSLLKQQRNNTMKNINLSLTKGHKWGCSLQRILRDPGPDSRVRRTSYGRKRCQQKLTTFARLTSYWSLNLRHEHKTAKQNKNKHNQQTILMGTKRNSYEAYLPARSTKFTIEVLVIICPASFFPF